MAHFTHGFMAIRNRRLRARRDLEEEKMTSYSNEEMEKDWEFKIVRNEYGIFRKPEVFQQLLDEEAIAGWEMLEKLDDSRVRFKRKRSARKSDTMLPPGIDPYRSRFGGAGGRTIIVMIVTFLILLSGLAIAFVSAMPGEDTEIWTVVSAMPVILIFLGVFVMVLTKVRR